MIEQLFVPAVIAVSTALGFVLATRRFGWPARALASASGKVLEWVGATVVFCLLNAAVGAALIVAGRAINLYAETRRRRA